MILDRDPSYQQRPEREQNVRGRLTKRTLVRTEGRDLPYRLEGLPLYTGNVPLRSLAELGALA